MHIQTKKFIFVIIVVTLILVFIIFQNSNLNTTTINYSNNKLPKEFDGYTIIQISDLHNKRFGDNQVELLNEIKKEDPDMIVVTGDLIDRRRYDLDIAMMFIDGAIEIAPVYFVSGNHEAWSFKYDEIKAQLLDAGVVVLDDEVKTIAIDNSSIDILGLKDPAFDTPEGFQQLNLGNFQNKLDKLKDDDNFQILLSHRPELFGLYCNAGIDLTFSGHAHGGQFRLPIIGGFFAPNQGFFPKYTNGSHKLKDSTLIVSRGLGNSVIPLRIFNNPEIVKVVLRSSK